MLRLILLTALPLLAVTVERPWDPRYARVMGVAKDSTVGHTHGTTYDGSWDCPWHLDGTSCADGEFKCKCSNGGTAKFSIGCCYHFPKCGRMCHNWNCNRYLRCATCKGKVGEWNYNACDSCVKGYVYENGLCDKDLNECAQNNGKCEQRCHNTHGSYYCSCVDGFKMNDDKHTCTRLSCSAVSSTSQVSVAATQNWLYKSFAKFEQTDKAMTLEGPEIAECVATGVNTRWDVPRPATVNTCTYVAYTDRQRCPGTVDGVSQEKCLQLGCCYDAVGNGESPNCYINPVKSYIRFGGVSPIAGEDKGFKHYKHFNTETCAHRCQNTNAQACKSFGVKTTGSNGTHGVDFHQCYMLSKTKAELEKESKIVKDPKYDMYEKVEFKVEPYSTVISGLGKQYVGCYLDDPKARDLPHHVLRSTTHMDPATCVTTCRQQRYRYAGVQNGADCYCGNGYYRKHGLSQECKSPCSGDSNQMCGGVSSNSVYTVAWTDNYQGCYADDDTSHDLPVFIWGTDAGRSAAECMLECTKKNYKYAGLQDGGACYCGNKFGSYGGANETSCSSHCFGYARQNCGGNQHNAVYKTQLVSNIDSIGSDPYRLYDLSGSLSGLSTSLFTLYPGLQSILSKRIIIHSTSKVLTPADDYCGKDCYAPCGDIYQEKRITNKGSDVTLRFFYLNLSELDDYVGSAVKRVYVHAQTVFIDKDIKLGYALYLRAQNIIMDRSRAYNIDVSSDAKDFDIDVESQKFYDPETDTLHQKQSMMCARILLDTQNQGYIRTAFSILNTVGQTRSQIRETQAVAATAQNILVETAGLSRENVRFVPFYTKAHLKKLLDNYFEKISIYEEKMEKMVDENNSKNEFLDYVEDMHDIYSETNILEASTGFEAAITAVDHSNATYHRFRMYYNDSREELERARVGFEDGLQEKKNWEIGKFLINVVASIAKATFGALEYDKETSDDDIDGIKIDIVDLFGLMQELSETIAQIDELSDVADKVIAEIEHLEDEFDAVRYYDEVEMSVQLQVNIIKWQNLKNYGETLLTQDDVAAVRGCSEYHRHLLDVCNWGEALTRSMVERSEMIREAMYKRTVLDLKKEQKKRIDEHIQKYRDDLYGKELLINEMVEQSYDIRLDLNDALLMFCQAYFYENMFECKPGYKPSFGGSLEDLLLKVNSAKRDDLLVGVAPSTLKRYITIEDTNTDPECNDALVCPINYLRANRLLYFNVLPNHPDLKDMDAYKVSEIILTFNGAKASTDEKNLKVQIESSGYFKGRANDVIHNFLTRALSLVFEYDISNNFITVHADVYKPFRNIIQHITPFTTWVMRVSDGRSKDIDLSQVTSVRVQFNGSGVDNETWRKKFAEAHGKM